MKNRIHCPDRQTDGTFGMGYRILFFYAQPHTEEKCQSLTFAERELGGEEGPLKVFSCGVPEHYGIRAGQLLSLMQECCVHVSADACYLEERFARELAERGVCPLMDRQRMCGELIWKICGSLRAADSILYLCGKPDERERELPVPEKLLRKLRYFFYMGERKESRAILEENLWQEYGMPLLSVGKMADLTAWQVGRLLVIDDRREGYADWEMLPHGSVYLDLWSDAVRRAQTEKNRADVKYLSEYLYLRQNLPVL